MSRTKKNANGCLLVLLFVLLGATILWIGVPVAANTLFGAPSSALTNIQRWSYGVEILLHYHDLTQPVTHGTMLDQKYSILPEESINSITIGLESANLIRNASAFRAYLIYKGLDSQIKAGDFNLSPVMNAVEIAEAVQSTYTSTVAFYIYPGWRAEEIAAALPTSGIEVTPEEFLQVVRNPAQLSNLGFITGFPSAEGFLFPGQYEVSRKISAEELVTLFVSRFSEKIDPSINAVIEAQGLTLYQGVTLASIIQRETFKDSERAIMASVFYNRLAAGMKLETDPTVQYAIGYTDQGGGWWKTPLSLYDLKVNSPYNTYMVTGLPPTPISNPDMAAILAVAYPENTPFLYFRAMCDGSGFHNFSETFEEHTNKTCK